MPETIFTEQVMPATGKMYRYAFSILGNKVVAQDVVQDCLAKIWQNRNKLKEVHNIDAWVMRITPNQCYDWVKLNRFSLQSGVDINRDDITAQETSTTDEEMLLNERLHWLQQVVGSLPQKQQEIYHLREVEEMAYQDIAEVLSLSLSDVKVALHRTRQKIKTTLEKIDTYGLAN